MRIAGFQSFAVLCMAVCTHGWHCPGNRFSARLLFERRSRCVWLLLAGEHRPVQCLHVAQSWKLLAARLRVLSDSIPCGIPPVGSRRRRISLHLCRRVPPSVAVGPTLGISASSPSSRGDAGLTSSPRSDVLGNSRCLGGMRWTTVQFAEEIAMFRGLVANQVGSALQPRLHSVLSDVTPVFGDWQCPIPIVNLLEHQSYPSAYSLF